MLKACTISRLAIALLFVCPAVGVARAKSSLLLPYPPDLGRVPVITFDSTGRQVGHSEFSLEALESGRYLMQVTIRIDGGGENRIRAELEPVESTAGGPQYLRILTEQSQSFDATGQAMTLLQIDHSAGFASCTPPGADSGERIMLRLPLDDRVANVPMNLLFLPLVRGEVERVYFQLFVCRGGPRIHEFVALQGGPPTHTGDREIIEVRYGPDLGEVMSWVASRVLPKLSFWFDIRQNGAYVAHRMPIYSKGPEVLTIRDDVQPPALGHPF